MTCPNCNAPDQSGNFCAECGAPLDITCPSCKAAVPGGAEFCTQCGTRLRRGGGRSRAGWVIAAAAVFVVALVFLVPRQTQRAGPTQPGAAAAPFAAAGEGEASAGGAGAPGMGVLSGDMRVNADRLFNRIMTAAETGNEAEVQQFMPMAIQAYGMVDDLDPDGVYHLAILHLTAGDFAQATATADRLLQQDPDHILGLGVKAEAAAARGDSTDARTYYRRIVDAYPRESAKPRPEYVEHQAMLELYRKDALAFLGES